LTGAQTCAVTIWPASCSSAAARSPARLKGLSLALAKRVITAVNCKLGKVTKAASKKVKKGVVISSSPGAGKTLANGTKIKVVQSSGPSRKKGRTS
jgi:beta-lactam-binding protein with PASTA domain